MFPGNLTVINLIDQKALNYRKHTRWWIIALLLLMAILAGQRYMLTYWYKADIASLDKERSYQHLLAKQLQTRIELLPKILVQQNQYKHVKLSVLLRLLQQNQSADTRINNISWLTKLRIEGEAKSRDSISQLQSSFVDSGYFSNISLEQLRQQEQAYTFSLSINFAEGINFALLAEQMSQ